MSPSPPPLSTAEAFSPGLLQSADSRAALYAASVPYYATADVSLANSRFKHCVIDSLANPTLLAAAKKEVLTHITFESKETDIYRVGQTVDLANLSALSVADAQKLPALLKLRAALYSSQFREFVQTITSCGELNDSVDMSINLYSKGCHLLTHDDVIGTRKVSYILYLAQDWKPEYGGALRLYDTVTHGHPETMWCKTISPLWNRICLFSVTPGKSFHDVEEILVDQDRMAISGWFHGPKEETFGSSLNSIRERGALDEPKPTFEQCVESELALENWINDVLLLEDSKQKLCSRFCDDSIIRIDGFLNEEIAQAMKMKIVEEGNLIKPWSTATPPTKHRYLYQRNDFDHFASDLVKVFTSKAFTIWLREVTGLEITTNNVLARKFRPGLDYTLATSESNTLVEVVLDLTPSEGWESGNMGGYQVYMTDDEGESDPSVYQSGAGGILHNQTPEFNVLTIVMRDAGLLGFTKYVSSLALCCKWDIFGQFDFEEVPSEIE
ncbi:Prolyl 3,4-dihydroxylase ofd1 [Neolecta irregularis DAH-3]|uniref:Prolyl 3,4-dihydroxylase ofd1 n=1 Tax=Neolecta irregularis (strain DAH-3) TaxID=1198029 RepID=A0A1U7LI60_NEOID|nr:Prolyl 3,4-dihydroxylase ofd1 [Neolecta irregularis DAH-3]|eukprot:OLL22346.1 Prolyl 3,4-dihydroxylase ofd1 [Neolecta irregularis DAH-3]